MGATLGLFAPIFLVSLGLPLEPTALAAARGFTLALPAAGLVGKLAGAARPVGLRLLLGSQVSSREGAAKAR